MKDVQEAFRKGSRLTDVVLRVGPGILRILGPHLDSMWVTSSDYAKRRRQNF